MKSLKFLIVLALLPLAACTPPPGETGAIQTPSQAGSAVETAPASPAVDAQATPTLEPTALPTILPTETPASLTAQPASTEVSSGPQMVQIFLIGIDDNGRSGRAVGCGDSAIPVQVEIQPTQGVLKAALEALLGLKQQFYGESGLYNALYQSNLQVQSVKIENETAIIHLVGSLMLDGECDNPRVAAQLEETARQFSTVEEVSIFLNDKTLAEALSLK